MMNNVMPVESILGFSVIRVHSAFQRFRSPLVRRRLDAANNCMSPNKLIPRSNHAQFVPSKSANSPVLNLRNERGQHAPGHRTFILSHFHTLSAGRKTCLRP